MSNQPLSPTNLLATRVSSSRFVWAFKAFATIAPMILVAYAYLASPQSMERAHLVVQGSERIVFLLAAALILRAFYLFGVRDGTSYLGAASGMREGALV
jgi:hypothetical protein